MLPETNGVANNIPTVKGDFKMKFQRNTPFFFLILTVGCLCVIGGIFLLVTESINSFHIIFGGVGVILLILGITESNKNKSKFLITTSFLLYGLAFLSFSYSKFQESRLITASVFAISGILILVCTAIFTLKRGE